MEDRRDGGRLTATPTTFELMEIRERLSTADWAEGHIYLSPRIPTPEPGQWSRAHVPAWTAPEGPLEALDDPDCESVVAACGAQVGKTMTGYAWLAKELATDPSSALLVMNSSSDAKEKCSETWLPMWEDSPALARFLPHDRRSHWTKMEQRINRSPVYWVGANSPGRLGAKPIRRLVLDECDKYPAQSKREAGAAALARQRLKAFRQKGLAKLYEASTPTDDTGEIWQEYLQGDQRKLVVRCHACGVEHVMVWAAFRVDMKLAKTDPATACAAAHYECPHCKAAWTDGHRYAAIAAGRWVPTAVPRDPLCRSYQMPSWCSTFVTHTYLATQWIRAQASKSALQDFINSECAEPYLHYENLIADSLFARHEGAYDEGQTWLDVEPYASLYPEVERVVYGGVDVQKGYLVATFRQFAQGGDSGLVWHGTVANFATLDDLAGRFGAQFILVDQRYRTREVQEWCETHPGYIPCLGAIRKARALYTVQILDIDEGKRGQGRTGRQIEVIEHDPDMLKDILAEQLHGGGRAKTWLVPRGYPTNPEYVAGMTAERCVNGRWINPQNRPNHAWDSELLCLLAAIRFGVWAMDYGAQEGEVEQTCQ